MATNAGKKRTFDDAVALASSVLLFRPSTGM